MPDKYTKSKTTSYGSRVLGSIKGIFVGFVFFIFSFFILFWGEGIVDLSKIADDAVQISAETVDSSTEGALVYTRDSFISEQDIGDGLFLKEANYIQVIRTVETYAWEEETETETMRGEGGSETTETTYTYKKTWVHEVSDSTTFEVSEGHENIQPTLTGSVTTANDVMLGAYAVTANSMTFAKPRLLALAKPMLTLNKDVDYINETYLFQGKGSINKPEIGDMRISYRYIPEDVDYTVFGQQSGSELVPFFGEKNTKLYHAYEVSRNEALVRMNQEYKMKKWLYRGVGFGFMWGGLVFMLGPLAVIADRFKFTGSIAGGFVKGVSLLVALVLSITTILISNVLHSPWLLIGVVLVVGGLLLYRYKNK